MKRVLDKVRKKVTPTKKEYREMDRMIDRAVAATEEVTKPLGLGHTLAGSFIRNTWMPDKKEFEIFILFPENTSREELEKQGLDVGKQIVDGLKGRYVIAYAEHPYVRARAGGFDIDIVPCYRLKSAKKIKSAVDRTPFHNQWIARNMPRKLSIEVRLLKRFSKTLGVYGSDTRVQGFSGYLCELLIVYYGSFEALAKSAAHWEPGRVFIDLQKHHKNTILPEQLRHELKQKFRNQPLVVIDPVDPARNVAAAFSPEKFARFVLACERFVRQPSFGAFYPVPEKIDTKSLRKAMEQRGTKLLLVQFDRPSVIDDVLWPQLRRTASRLKDIMIEHDFLVLDWGVHSDLADLSQLAESNESKAINNKKTKRTSRSSILLEMGVWKLPKIRKVTGPPVFIRQRAKEFRKKYERLGKVWVEGDRLATEVRRNYLDARAKLEDTLSNSLKELKAKGIASHIAESIAGSGRKGKARAAGGFKILEEELIIARARRDREFGLFLKKYLERGL